MSDQQQEREGRAPTPPTFSMQNTPNAERYVLEADAMRGRQMRSGLLHGSTRTWREHQRVWPAVVVGIILVAVVVAGLAVRDAYRTQQREQREEQRRQEQQRSSAPAVPGPTAPASPTPPAEPPASPSAAR